MKRVTERLREKEFRHPPIGRASESSSNPTSEEQAIITPEHDKHRESPVNSNRQRLMADRAKHMSRSIPNLATKVREDEDDNIRCTGEGSSATGSNDENKNHKQKTR